VDPVVVGPVGGSVVLEQLWSQLRHGLAVIGLVIFIGLVAAASCWCCGYVTRGDLAGLWMRSRRSAGGPSTLGDGPGEVADLTTLDDAAIADEAARGIRALERYLSAV
jgi:hypothetical protein